ncbi:hypothetical protein MUN82_14510 [Hymenobacter aerilatus]|uniref:Uncharacterized protein n=1 Tax=Hymenobacter aerilatus TaxID=2932251 RepID=A0A8T9STV9_9BACT|nr:hypothetical protein [Hymenobacter aerilatus]UOR04153.1 hypothetical protein MUN82_14510 [Hymenobacter aerilatus]
MMQEIRTFSAPSEDMLWQQVAADMSQQPDLLEYRARLVLPDFEAVLYLDIDLGGGFEGGFATTSLVAMVPPTTTLRFALHEQDWVHEIGKLFGMEDAQLGYPEIDDAFIVKTNDAPQLAQLLAAPEARITLVRHPKARITLAPTDEDEPPYPGALVLRFEQDEAITDPTTLRDIHWLLHTLARPAGPVTF